MLGQNRMMRAHALGNFHDLLVAVTRDPAMLLWLSGTSNTKYSPNENYAREVMELFTLGADRGAYTQHDVREQARALTGFANELAQLRTDELPLRSLAPRRRDQDGSSAIAVASTSGIRAGCASSTRCTRRS